MTRIKKCICILLCMTMICGTISFSIEADATESSNVTGETESVLTGKSILFAGDSITKAGTDDGDRVGWAQIIGDTYNMTWTNAGVSGASISTVRDNRVLTQLEANKETSYDYVILHGGVNDAWDSASVGAISTSFDVDVFDTSTFAGGLEELFYYACKYYEGARIGYIVNFAMPNSSVENLRDMSAYFNVAEQICDKWNIPYIDLYSGSVEVEGQTLSYSYDILQVDECTQDTIGPCFADTSVHLNGKGYDAISPYIAKWIETIEEAGTFDSVLSDKSILFVGDSITDGAKDTYTADRANHGDGWAERIGTMYNMTWNNAGSSGASVSTVVSTNRVLTQIENNKDTSYDYVILHGGVNDAMSGAIVGQMSDSKDVANFDINTFAGALEELIYRAREYYTNAKIGYIVNYATPNATTWGNGNCKDMSAYFDVAKQICDKWEIPYIDLYEGRTYVDGVSLSYSYDILKVDTGEYMFNNDPDEVHIGAKGYDVITPYIARWIETLADTVEAATPEGVDYIVEKHTNISAYRTYRTDNAFSMPTIVKTETTGEWLFAGWYKDVNCTSAIKSSVKGMVMDGEYYAKFVSADVLSVKCQISKDTTFDSPSTILRCVSSVDSLKYSKIGFDLITPDGTKKNVESRSVGTRIKVTEDNQKDSYSYSPKVIDTESEYFYSAMEEISQENFEKGYVVKPYWITKDGTKVYGVSRYVKVSEGIDNGSESDVIHMPIKMNVEPEVGSTLTVQDMGVANFVKYDDNGYAHYALNVPDKSALKSVTQYTVKDGEKIVGEHVYRNLNTKYNGNNTSIDTSWYSADSSEDEFVIATSADLYGLASIVNGEDTLGSKTIYVVSDIAAGYAWKNSIGSGTSKYFGGIFDGQGHTISGLKSGSQSLFGYALGCTIKNFSLKGSEFTAASIAYTFDGTMENVYSDAKITATGAMVGGLVARLTNEGKTGDKDSSKAIISNCWYAGDMEVSYNGSGSANCGGVAGVRIDGKEHKISNCLYTGTMIIANNSTSTELKYTAVAGILGSGGYCEFADCVSAGDATVTFAEGTEANFPKRMGAVSGGTEKGVSIAEGSYVYATKEWDGNILYNITKDNAIVPEGNVDNYESYINMPALDYYTQTNKNGKWVVRENAVPALKAFEDEWIDVAWYFDTENYNQGGKSFDISTKEELYGLSAISQTYTFAGDTINLTSDITMNSGKATDWAAGKNTGDARLWKPIGMPSEYQFKGSLNGNNHTISGIYCSAVGGHTGFIGQLVGGTVNNLQLSNSYFSRGGANVGGLAAYMKGGEVNSVYCDVIVNQTNVNSNNVGGLIGWATGTVSVTNSWFAGTVTSKGRYTGGIVGFVNGTANITDCLVTGKVQGNYTGLEATMYVGGILGGDDKGNWTLTRCFMAGEMSVVDSTKKGVAPLVGSVVGGTSKKTRVLTDCYTTTQDYSFFVCEPDGLADNNKVTGAESCEFVDTASKDNVPDLFVEGSTTWTTDEDGYAVLNF
ncbi:MAG: SGNH/GDSL hydrolase family protein [Tyzzerella sp.]|nr:SGNH/GDSL hydrolase family protein [Tyzzerella sp.]